LHGLALQRLKLKPKAIHKAHSRPNAEQLDCCLFLRSVMDRNSSEFGLFRSIREMLASHVRAPGYRQKQRSGVEERIP
jgi:hypothetical protein